MGALDSVAALVVVEMVGLALLTVLMVQYFRSPELTPTFISVTVGASWYLGFLGTLLLPLDIAHAATIGSSSTLVVAWDCVYWSTFWLCWVVLPVLYEAWYAGDLTWRGRLLSAVKANIKFYAAVALLGLAAAVYLMASKQMTMSGISDFLMVFGNTYGLLLVAVLLGNGLVELPRSIWRMRDTSRAIERLQLRAVAVDTEVYDSRCELEDAEKQARHMQLRMLGGGSGGGSGGRSSTGSSGDESDDALLREHMDLILGACDADDSSSTPSPSSFSRARARRAGGESTARTGSGSYARDEGGALEEPTAASLAQLHRRVRVAKERAHSASLRWQTLLLEYAAAKEGGMNGHGNESETAGSRRGTGGVGKQRGGRNMDETASMEPVLLAGAIAEGADKLRAIESVSSSSSSSAEEADSNSGGGGGVTGGGKHGPGVGVLATFLRTLRFSGVGRAFLAALAAFCGALSLVVVWSELTMGLPFFVSPWGVAISALSGAARRDGAINSADNAVVAWIQLVAVIPYAYMSICTFYSLFKVKFFGMIALYGPHHSTPGPLLFNAIYLIRLQFPLGFNYLLTVYPPGLRKTHGEDVAFNALMSSMDTVPLFGTGFVVYAPIFLVVLCAFTLFNCYPRLLALVGIDHEDAAFAGGSGNDEDIASRRREGSILLERAVRRDSVPSVSTLRKRDLSGSSSGKSETSQGPLSCVDRLYFPRLSRTLGGGQLLTTIRI
jgi:hypothetical protein